MTIHKPSLGSCEVPQNSVAVFWCLSDTTNKKTNHPIEKQSKNIDEMVIVIETE